MGMAIVEISASLFRLISPQPGSIIEVTSNDVPPDAKFVGVTFDGQTFVATVRSDSIPETPAGERLPRLTGPRFSRSDAPLVLKEHEAYQTVPGGDAHARMQRYRNAIMTGKMSINLCRELEGLPTIGPAGDSLYFPGDADVPEIEIAKKTIKVLRTGTVTVQKRNVTVDGWRLDGTDATDAMTPADFTRLAIDAGTFKTDGSTPLDPSIAELLSRLPQPEIVEKPKCEI